jgi:hypothetical protein
MPAKYRYARKFKQDAALGVGRSTGTIYSLNPLQELTRTRCTTPINYRIIIVSDIPIKTNIDLKKICQQTV